MSGILTDCSILSALASGDICINPFEPAHLNTTSYDLTLGDEVAVYASWVEFDPTLDDPRVVAARGRVRDGSDLFPKEAIMDVKKKPDVHKFRIDPELGWVLKPGIGYLMHTAETVHTNVFEPIVDGKSSPARLFIKVHFTAGYGDPGFNGQYTLEVEAKHPVRVYPGMRIAQIRFHTLEGPIGKLYSGNYQGETARGPQPSRVWNQFSK